ncbi:uncharacterized protein yc1106_04909 [Curvularia clavata]|uniref:Tyrosinase copper-binding domain-containing protein n=1 Tax=Curvularia clavata TaxID=95742 RepID=A0A9Q9DT46_CURCL|nr:uncharacterized protein yc1106_04909 [Curvularia clavata]
MVALDFRAVYALFPLLSFLHVLVSADAINDLEAKGRPALYAALANSTTCTKEKLQVRREWGDLPVSDKLAYIAAVKCLINNRPSQYDRNQYPGARSRFDDFIVVHMKQSQYIHGTGSFLTWHRYFTAAYEHALRKECHYNGTQPYWHWGRWAESPQTSPLFDGSPTSIGGQGEHVPHNSTLNITGEGGGCIASGPFKDMKVNLGPVSITQTPAPARNPRPDGFGYNPRCVKRDITNILTMRYATTDMIYSLMTNCMDIGSFQTKMQGPEGVHGAGHFTIAGDPGGDFYTSPGDVGFWFHHSMIDRVYTGWQGLDFAHRQQVIAGVTRMNDPNSTLSTLDDIIDLEAVNIEGKAYKIRELVSTVQGPFCYTYE